MTVRFAKTLVVLWLAMSQVVGGTLVQASHCSTQAECCCCQKTPSNHCCCCHAKQTGTRSCCHHSNTVQQNSKTKSPRFHHLCGCGCQQSSQPAAPLSTQTTTDELNPHIGSKSCDEVITVRSDSVYSSDRGTHENHAFYAEIPQELMFCAWLL